MGEEDIGAGLHQFVIKEPRCRCVGGRVRRTTVDAIAIELLLLLLVLGKVGLFLCLPQLRDHFGSTAFGAFFLGDGIVCT